MEKQIRKHKRLKSYDYSQNGAYFITICTQDRRPILGTIIGDGESIPKPIGKIAEEYIRRISEKYPGITVDRYVLMPDHIHILLRIDGTEDPSYTMGNVVGWYKYQVTKQANLLLNTPGGKLFQRSYYDHVIRNQQDYDEIWQYIENNPRKWVMKPWGTGFPSRPQNVYGFAQNGTGNPFPTNSSKIVLFKERRCCC